MKLGIVGLPNAGKTTLFNALTGQEMETAVYPGAPAAEPHIGAVKVPDRRLVSLTGIFKPKKTVHADVMCADITGFAKGISSGSHKAELFNQTWDCEALTHVVRAFEDPSVIHPENTIDPVRDAALLELELIFHDLELAETRLERIAQDEKKGIAAGKAGEKEVLEKCRTHLEYEKPLRNLELSAEELKRIGSLQFVSLKPELVVLNVSEEQIGSEEAAKTLKELSDCFEKDVLTFSLSGKIEMEISRLSPEEAALFLEDLGIAEPALSLVIREAYELLGLISFFTVGEDEVRAWTIRAGTPAVRAAGKIHSDMERGFIKAEVIGYDDFMAAGSMAAAREQALLRLEGKDYVVRDGDIITFRFNV